MKAVREIGFIVDGADIDTKRLPPGAHSIVEGRTDLPNASFDVVYSQEVLEHVANLDAVAVEIARLTRPGGWGFHVFPARWGPVEAHLRQPFVHWLPKNLLRLWAIRLLFQLGVGARPPELPSESSAAELAAFQYDYSIRKTFYRPRRQIARTFRRHGFEVQFVESGNRRVQALPRPFRWLVGWSVGCFANVHLETRLSERATNRSDPTGVA